MGETKKLVFYKSKKFIALLIILALLLLGALAIRSLAGEAEGTVNNGGNTAAYSESAQPSLIKVNGQYLSFSYPDNYHRLPVTKNPPPTLESFSYSAAGVPSAQLSIIVSELPTNKLDDSSSYQLRQQKPQQYKLETWQLNNQSVPVFSDTTVGYSKVAYLVHGGKLATIALSGGTSIDKSTSVQKKVINSVVWK